MTLEERLDAFRIEEAKELPLVLQLLKLKEPDLNGKIQYVFVHQKDPYREEDEDGISYGPSQELYKIIYVDEDCIHSVKGIEHCSCLFSIGEFEEETFNNEIEMLTEIYKGLEEWRLPLLCCDNPAKIQFGFCNKELKKRYMLNVSPTRYPTKYLIPSKFTDRIGWCTKHQLEEILEIKND